MQITVGKGLLFRNKETILLGVGRLYFFTDEDVGERLIGVDQARIIMSQIVFQFADEIGRIFDFWKDTFGMRLFFAVKEESAVLKEVDHEIINFIGLL